MNNLFTCTLTIGALAFSCASFAAKTRPTISTEATAAVQIPAGNILSAARKIVLPTHPRFYSVSGELTCGQVTREMTTEPYSSYDVSSCFITIGDKTELVNNPDEIVNVLQKVKPRTPPASWTLTAPFSALWSWPEFTSIVNAVMYAAVQLDFNQLNSQADSNSVDHSGCGVRREIFDLCFNATNNIDDTDEDLVQSACAAATEKVAALTNGIYRCKVNDGSADSLVCVLRTNTNITPRAEKFDCRSDYRQENQETCTDYPHELLSAPYCEWR